MKILSFLSVVLFSIHSFSAYASTCEEQLETQLMNSSNIRMVRVVDTYSCDNDACAIAFENDEKPYANNNVLAYLDLKNEMSVFWSPIHDNKASGWEGSGTYFCADVKTYLKADLSDNKVIQLALTQETARDALFCPISKQFKSFRTTCIKSSR